MARIRTFLAIELTKPIRDRLVALQDELARSGTQVKWTEQDNLHLTLVFLGEVDDREVPRVCRIASDTVQSMAPFRLAAADVGCFPNSRRPRILWVGIGAGTQELVGIHDALEEPLLELGYRREERRYTPHITLGRIAGEGASPQLTAALASKAGWQGGEMVVSEIVVMSSELAKRGPIYTVLGRGKLGA